MLSIAGNLILKRKWNNFKLNIEKCIGWLDSTLSLHNKLMLYRQIYSNLLDFVVFSCGAVLVKVVNKSFRDYRTRNWWESRMHLGTSKGIWIWTWLNKLEPNLPWDMSYDSIIQCLGNPASWHCWVCWVGAVTRAMCASENESLRPLVLGEQLFMSHLTKMRILLISRETWLWMVRILEER